MSKAGRLFVLSAPSGSGKTTMLRALLRRDRNRVRSISATTRPPRAGERHGKDYFFISHAQFRRGIARGKFLEHARVLRNWYGLQFVRVEDTNVSPREFWVGDDDIRAPRPANPPPAVAIPTAN